MFAGEKQFCINCEQTVGFEIVSAFERGFIIFVACLQHLPSAKSQNDEVTAGCRNLGHTTLCYKILRTKYVRIYPYPLHIIAGLIQWSPKSYKLSRDIFFYLHVYIVFPKFRQKNSTFQTPTLGHYQGKFFFSHHISSSAPPPQDPNGQRLLLDNIFYVFIRLSGNIYSNNLCFRSTLKKNFNSQRRFSLYLLKKCKYFSVSYRLQ